MNKQVLSVVPVLLLSLAGCHREEGLTQQEAAEAVEELEISSSTQAMSANTIEVNTSFTIGQAVQNAAEELRAFLASQLACAAVMVSDHTLSIEYGANGVCLYNGQEISGTHTVSIAKNEDAEVVVDHTWEGLTNGKFVLDGTATVTWNKEDPSRHVEHDLSWTKLPRNGKPARTGHGQGDRIQRPLAEGGIAEGFSEDGQRTWDGRRGHWSLDIDQLEMHWRDPVPRSGSLVLDTPFEKTVTIGFSEVDADTIHVDFEGPNRSIGVNVNRIGG